MKNKSVVMVKKLIESLKKDVHSFGNLAVVEIHGTYGARAEIAMQFGKSAEVYSVIVVRNNAC